jgi:hypothetical protein
MVDKKTPIAKGAPQRSSRMRRVSVRPDAPRSGFAGGRAVLPEFLAWAFFVHAGAKTGTVCSPNSTLEKLS